MGCLVRYSTYSTYSKDPGDCEGSAAWCLPHLTARPRHLPGIEASCRARAKVGILPRKKKIQSSRGRTAARFFLPMAARPQDCLLQLKDCLLQSCCHPRIASFNPVVTPGLRGTPRELHRGQLRKNGTCLFPVPNSTRAATKKWLVPVSSSEALRKHKCHLCFPASHSCPASEPPRRPDCAENTGSASVHSDALPDSPPGLPGKLRQRPATQQDADGLAARLPGFKFGK